MIRLFHIYFPSRTILLVMCETLLVVCALVSANFLRFGTEAELRFLYERAEFKTIVASAVCMLCMYYYDLYESPVLSNRRETITRLVQVLGTACVLLSVAYYAFPPIRLEPDVLLVWIVLVGSGLIGGRNLFVSLARLSGLVQRTVLLGSGRLANALAMEIERRPELGLELVGYLSTAVVPERISRLPLLGGSAELPDVPVNQGVQRIVVAEAGGQVPVEELLRLKSQGIMVEDGADLYEAITGKVSLDALQPSWLLYGFRLSRSLLAYKRCCAILGAIAGLIVTAPLMLLIAAAVRLDSAGPVIFRQKRVGKGGRIFTLYKFRSMWVNADRGGTPRPVCANDARITRVGRWLRRTRLDELPQLVNILRGDMYFVGPRPFTPNMEADLCEQIPFYDQRWALKPGATGWAQVQHGYCATLQDNREKLAYDLFYIKNLAVGLDCLILFHTIKILLLGRGAR